MLGFRANHLTWLAQRGHLAVRKAEGRNWFAEDEIRAYAEQRHRWVSYDEAARIIGCNHSTIGRLVKHGMLEQRIVRRALPSLDRSSVEAIAERWATRQHVAPTGQGRAASDIAEDGAST